MMAWIARRSVKARGLAVGLAVLAIVLGVAQLRAVPRDVLPEFQPPTVEVQTEALGLSAGEVEQLITVPLEQDLLNGVAFLDVIRSRSVSGLSSIELIFKPGTDLSRARLLVNERLTQAHALPNVSKPPQMLQPLSSTSRVMMIGLSSRQLSLIDLSVLARWTIRPRLMGVPGVASVAVWGQRDRQLQVQVDPEQLRSRGVTLDQVIRTTGNAMFVSPLSFLEASTPGTGGFIDGPNQRLGVQHNLPIKTPADLAKVVVEGTGVALAAPAGGPAPPATTALRLGDVARVVEDHQPLIGDASSTDGKGLILVVEKFPRANVIEVTRGVDKALKALAPGLTGVKVDASIYRPATYVAKSTSNVTKLMVLSLLILTLMVGAFLFDWRAAMVCLVSVAVSMIVALLVLYVSGRTINAMVLAGLVLGLVVVADSVIVDAENISRRLRRRRAAVGEQPASSVIVDACLQVRRPLVFASLIIVLALSPIFALKGEAGVFFPALAVAYATAALVSVVVALTVTPSLCMLLAPDRLAQRRQAPALRLLSRGHDLLFPRMTGSAVPALCGIVVLVLVGVATLPFLTEGTSLIPSFKDTGLLIHVDGPPGTSLPEMSRITSRLSAELAALAGVRDVGGHIGRAVMSDQVVGSSSSELWVSLDPAAGYDSTVASIRKVVRGYPGLGASVSTYPQERINQVLPKHTNDIAVRIFGQDPGVLATKAAEVSQEMSKIDGIVNPRVQAQPVEPSIEVEVDLAAAQGYGVKPGDVRRAAAVVLSGIEVGSLFEQQKVFDVVVWGTPQARSSLNDVRDVLIDTPTGDRVRLGDVAKIRIAPSPTVIQHQSVSRYIDVGADVQGRDTGAVAGEINSRLAAMSLPLEYHAELLGDYGEGRAAHLHFLAVAVAAAIGILLLLQAAFGSWRLAALTFLLLPVSLVGGLVATVIDGGRISLGSLIGLFAVFGIAVHHVVVLVSRYQHPDEPQDQRSPRHLVAEASRQRSVPVVLTTVGVALALLPFVFLGHGAGLELAHPMAMVVLGGLVTSALLSLLIMPGLYLRFGPRIGDGAATTSAPVGVEDDRVEDADAAMSAVAP
jgi:Cu/Ag efflux pump CusA